MLGNITFKINLLHYITAIKKVMLQHDLLRKVGDRYQVATVVIWSDAVQMT